MNFIASGSQLPLLARVHQQQMSKIEMEVEGLFSWLSPIISNGWLCQMAPMRHPPHLWILLIIHAFKLTSNHSPTTYSSRILHYLLRLSPTPCASLCKESPHYTSLKYPTLRGLGVIPFVTLGKSSQGVSPS